jgi:hypothetical protein
MDATHVTSAVPPGRLVGQAEHDWRNHLIRTEVYYDASSPGSYYVVLRPLEGLSEPDLLLYWLKQAPRGTELPADAQLLGPFVPGKPFILRAGQSLSGPHLVLYSLAHQTIVDAPESF